MRHARRDSADSVASEMSMDGQPSPNDTQESGHESVSYADIIDLTNYDDEEDVNDPAEMQLSNKLQQQGKVRRAKSRKADKARAGRSATSPTYVPSAYPPSRRSQLPYDDGQAEQQYALAAGGSSHAMLSPDSAQFSHGNQDPRNHPSATQGSRPRYPSLGARSNSYGQDLLQSNSYRQDSLQHSGHSTPRNLSFGASNNGYGQDINDGTRPFGMAHSRNDSYRSVSDSKYDRYDPYSASSGPQFARGTNGTNSPAPSIFQGDDNQSIAGDSVRHLVPQVPRSGSMVLLENDAGDPSGDAGLWIDQSDYQSLNIMTEMAKPGKPKLASVLEEEINRAEGRMIVASELDRHRSANFSWVLLTRLRSLWTGDAQYGRAKSGRTGHCTFTYSTWRCQGSYHNLQRRLRVVSGLAASCTVIMFEGAG